MDSGSQCSPAGLPLHFQVSLSDGGNVSCSGKKDTDALSLHQGQRGTVKLSGPGVTQAPGKSIPSPSRHSFHFHLAPNKNQAAGLQLHSGKTNSKQESLSHLCWLFQTADGDVLMNKNGWIYGKTTGRGMGGRRYGLKCTGTGGVSSPWVLARWARTRGSVPQAPGLCLSPVAWTLRDVQDRKGLASLVWSCCYPGNGPSGLQGLITFLKVFRSCEFWNDYINVALWTQSSARVIPLELRRKTQQNKGENAALWFRKTGGAES